jgi:hypothetical protein
MLGLRSNIHGGETAVHGLYLPDGVDWHLGGFQIVDNTIVCDHPVNDVGGGCTKDLNLIPDFAPLSDVTVDQNSFGANGDGSYCTYGGGKSTSDFPHADHVVYTNNVFQRGDNRKCGAFGPVTGFNVEGTGNRWKNNVWYDDGSEVPPEN